MVGWMEGGLKIFRERIGGGCWDNRRFYFVLPFAMDRLAYFLIFIMLLPHFFLAPYHLTEKVKGVFPWCLVAFVVVVF